jgi:hypothetical protein
MIHICQNVSLYGSVVETMHKSLKIKARLKKQNITSSNSLNEVRHNL